MNRKIKNAVAAGVLALGLGAGVAQADPFINGSVSAIGGFDNVSGAPNAIVSGLTLLDVSPLALFVGAIGDLTGGGGTAYDFNIPPAVGAVYSVGIFTFTITSVSNVANVAFACTAVNPSTGIGQCADQRLFDFAGTVSGAGFADTLWSGAWNAQGSCAGNETVGCTGGKTASWSSSLTALGANQIPEPGSLALLGLGLGALALGRRRKQS